MIHYCTVIGGAFILLFSTTPSYAAECLSRSVTQQAGNSIADPINPTALTKQQYETLEGILQALRGRWQGSGSRIDCPRIEGSVKSELHYSIKVESSLVSQDRDSLYLKFFPELEDKKDKVVSVDPYDFYLFKDVEIQKKKRGGVLRFGHETTAGATEILELAATKIVFTQKFKRRFSQEPNEFVRTLTLTGKALVVEELHYVEGELAVIKKWALKKS